MYAAIIDVVLFVTVCKCFCVSGCARLLRLTEELPGSGIKHLEE